MEEARSFGRLAAQELARISEIVNQTLRFPSRAGQACIYRHGGAGHSALALFRGKMRKRKITEHLA